MVPKAPRRNICGNAVDGPTMAAMDPVPDLPPLPTPPAEVRPDPRRITAIAWVVILATTGLLALRTSEARPDPAVAARTAVAAYRAQVRMAYGMDRAMVAAGGSALDGVLTEGPATVAVRQCRAVVAADHVSPARALEILHGLEELMAREARPFSGREAEVQAVLLRMYDAGDGEPPAAHGPEAVARLDPAERELLETELGWFGTLALHPPGGDDGIREALLDGASSAAVSILLFLGILVLLTLAAVAGLILFWYRVAGGSTGLRLGLRGNPAGVYAETFALWLVGFTLLQLAVALLVPEEWMFPALGAAFPASLLALRWPVVRGIPWDEVRRDVGLFAGSSPLAEVGCGVLSWCLNLPVMAAGMLASVVLVGLFSPGGAEGGPLDPVAGPGHPIQGLLGEDGRIWLVAFLACVCAPVVEEIFFRGVLYRHLREVTARASPMASVVVSSVITGILFAAIHPQGWMFIPALAAISWALIHAREWRDSLLAPIVAHALHNGLLVYFGSRIFDP